MGQWIQWIEHDRPACGGQAHGTTPHLCSKCTVISQYPRIAGCQRYCPLVFHARLREVERSIEALQRRVEHYLQSLEQADASDVDAEAVPPATIQAWSKLQAARTAGPNRPLSEPEARLMRGQDGPCYNVQTAVDSKCGVIVTHEVTDEATDNRSLQPMAEAAQMALATASLNVVTDAGYSNGEQVQALEEQGIVTYMPVKPRGQ